MKKKIEKFSMKNINLEGGPEKVMASVYNELARVFDTIRWPRIKMVEHETESHEYREYATMDGVKKGVSIVCGPFSVGFFFDEFVNRPSIKDRYRLVHVRIIDAFWNLKDQIEDLQELTKCYHYKTIKKGVKK